MANNTTSSCGDRSASSRIPQRLLLIPCLLLTVFAIACSSSSSSPPTTAPRVVIATPEPEPEVDIDALRAEGDRYYWLGVQAQDEGDGPAADANFDAALRVFMDADLPPDREAEFRDAFDDLVTRVHTQQLDEFQVPIESEATDLPQQEIPVLSNAEIEMLRARMADTLPAMPRFTIPVPADNPRVLEAIEYLTTNRAEVIQEGLSRSTRYLPMIEEIFAEAGVPAELAWIPLIESLFKPYVRSRASAVGLWQLMAPTARLYGLRVDWYVDERRDPIKSTYAIAQFIRDYHQEFGDWHLAIAAYNGGKGRVARAMRRSGATDFWSLASTRRYLPRETREFVPKILAAILIGTDPAHYGLQFEPQPVFKYDAVAIDSMTDLEVIADAAGTTLETIQDLNPQLLRRTTPNVDAYTIRVPEGSAAAFREAFAMIPESDRIRVVEHRIRNGETLSIIASSYGTSVAEITELNGIRNRHRIRAGHTLLIPGGSARATGAPVAVSRDVAQGAGYDRGDKVVHTVKNGESLWLIANAYGTTVSDIKRWNGLSNDRIDLGDKLDLYYGTRGAGTGTGAATTASAPAPPAAQASSSAAPSSAPAGDPEPMRYTVRRGDTLTDIARVHGVTASDLRSWNDKSSSRIYAGEKLTIYSTIGGEVTSTYTIRRGDTLTDIAQRFSVSVNELCAWNGISPRSTLYPGNRLQIRTATAGDAR